MCFEDLVSLTGAEMVVIRSGIFQVMDDFPDRSNDIRRLFKQSQAFHSLCEDYRQCNEALRYWNQISHKDAPARRQEYEVLQQQLVEEIRYFLNTSYINEKGK